MSTAIRRRSLVPAATTAIDLFAGHALATAGVATGFATVLQAALQEIEHTDLDPTQRVQPTARTDAAPPSGPLIVAGIVVPARLPR